MFGGAGDEDDDDDVDNDDNNDDDDDDDNDEGNPIFILADRNTLLSNSVANDLNAGGGMTRDK